VNIESTIKSHALQLGFSAVGIAPADYDPIGHNNLVRWLDSGYQAGMRYMERSPRKRYDPKMHLPGARSVIVCAENYYNDPRENERKGYISIYARGEDYHIVLKEKLNLLRDRISRTAGEFKSVICVDSSPIGEKALAVRAGIGFIGKNGTLIVSEKESGEPPSGSFHFLGVIITDLDLEPDNLVAGSCGECRRCIDACPTEAIVAEGVIDAGRCISYHTTENKGKIEENIAGNTRNMIFGCDICQLVCPYNKKARKTSEARLMARQELVEIDLEKLAGLTEEEFKIRFADSAIGDIKFVMFKRNIAMALKNISNYIN